MSAHASSWNERRWRELLARSRFEREYRPLLRRLASLARLKYRLAWEDCEELAADTLLSFHQELTRGGGVREDGAYLARVLRNRALDHKKALRRDKRSAGETVTLGTVENVGSDPQLDATVATREELRHLAEVAREVLSSQELEIVLLSKLGLSRSEIAVRHGLSVRQVERWLERSQRKLDQGADALRAHGRCQMLALTISEIKTGRIGPEHPRYRAAVEHLDDCWRCRATVPVNERNAA
jgi:RNA polymerase sigma factor (sigma-70 family)